MILVAKLGYETYACSVSEEELAAFSKVYCRFYKVASNWDYYKDATALITNERPINALEVLPGTLKLQEPETTKEEA